MADLGAEQLLQTPPGWGSYCKRRMIISDGYNGTLKGLRMSARMNHFIPNPMFYMLKQTPSPRWQNQTTAAKMPHCM
jgi:hypothetical protein